MSDTTTLEERAERLERRFGVLCREFERIFPSSDVLRDTALSEYGIVLGENESQDPATRASRLGEIYTLARWLKLEEQHPGEVEVVKLGRDIVTRDYRFHPEVKNGRRVHVVRRRRGEVETIPLIVLIGGDVKLPVRVETDYGHPGGERGDIDKALANNRVAREQDHLALLMNNTCYEATRFLRPKIMYIGPDEIIPAIGGSEIAVASLHEGGNRIARFGTYRKGWRDITNRAIEKPRTIGNVA